MALAPVPACSTRIGPLHPRLGRAAFRFLLPILERYYARHRTYRLNSAFAAEISDGTVGLNAASDAAAFGKAPSK